MGTFFNIEELSDSEIAVENNIDNIPDEIAQQNLTLLIDNVLDPIRKAYGKPIGVNSGYRNPQVNKLVKGSSTSEHLKGMAADIKCDNNKKLWDLIVGMIKDKRIQVTQLINEYPKNGVPSWIHVSYNRNNLKNQIFSKK